MTRYLILGAGRFGHLACSRLQERFPDSNICLVDRDPQKLNLSRADPALRTVLAAAAEYLAESLTSDSPPDWIIPAVPLHVAFDWLWLQRPQGEVWRQIPVPPALGQNLPFVQRGLTGEAYLSLSTRTCPDDCPEPAEKCFLTGIPRKFLLCDYLANLSLYDYCSVVIRSRQLAPGVGGYTLADLWQLRRQVFGCGSKIIISTACCCHGVSHALEKLTAREEMVDV